MESIQIVLDIPLDKIHELCMSNYRRHGGASNNDCVPYLKISTFENISLSIRYSNKYNEDPSWEFKINDFLGQSGYCSIEKAIYRGMITIENLILP